jgi:RecB family endonuclease NucS
MIDVPSAQGWLLYCDCEVYYDGRACSYLQRGNYLLIFKPDRSLSIHGSSLIQPRNYLAGGTDIVRNGNTIIFTCRKEDIKVIIHAVISFTPLEGWSDHKIAIRRTERELALKIFNNWYNYFNDEVELLHCEYGTELGPIDVLGQTLDTDIVIEVKRKTATIKDVTQLRRYVEAMEKSPRVVKGYLAAPAISSNARKYLTKHGLNYLQADFDDS